MPSEILNRECTGWVLVWTSLPEGQTKTIKRIILESLFADDCALMAYEEHDLQLTALIWPILVDWSINNMNEWMASSLSSASLLRSHTFLASPSVLARLIFCLQLTPNSTACSSSIYIDGAELKTLEEFKYLGSTIFNDGTLDKETNARIYRASQAL